MGDKCARRAGRKTPGFDGQVADFTANGHDGPKRRKELPVQRAVVGLATTVLVSSGLGLAGLGLAGTANTSPIGAEHWCPGQPMTGYLNPATTKIAFGSETIPRLTLRPRECLPSSAAVSFHLG